MPTSSLASRRQACSQVFSGFHEAGRYGVQSGVAPCAVVLQQQTVLMVHDRRDDGRFHSGEQQSLAVRFAGAALRPSSQRRFGRSAACGAMTLARMPYAQRDRRRGLACFARAGMRCESAQIDPVESFRSAFQQRFRRFRFRFVLFAERIVRAHMLAACGHRLRGFHARHVNGDHVFVAFAAIRSKEYGERRRMRVQFRRHVGAGQLRETHMHVGVVRDGSLSARHRHHAVFDENDLRGRLQQRRVEQVGFAASRNLIVDVTLRKWQERQCLSQRQW